MPTVSASPPPTTAASARMRGGTTITVAIASVITAVECPLGNAAGVTWASPVCPAKRG